MVNLEKWEEISYSEIKAGDTIRVITKQGPVINDTRGKADTHWNGWASGNGVKFLSHPDNFEPAKGGFRTIYRRKPKAKPFELPENIGAVLKVVHPSGASNHYTFTGFEWTTLSTGIRRSSVKLKDEILGRAKSVTVISEGVKL